MNKIRNLKIENKNNDTLYFKVDNSDLKVSIPLSPKKILEKYHNVNANKEIIEMIMQELNAAFNLTDDEMREYKKTLEYILED